jgi:hypothetical protein
MASETWSLRIVSLEARTSGQETHAILSGWPSPTDSEVKRKVPGLVPFAREPIVKRRGGVEDQRSRDRGVERN